MFVLREKTNVATDQIWREKGNYNAHLILVCRMNGTETDGYT